MNEHSGENKSVWMTTPLPQFPSLHENTEADVCIVGGGIAGLSTAYRLTREKKSVVLIDDGPICSGETERTTAHLTAVLDDRFFETEKLHGTRGIQLIADSHQTAIESIESNVREEKIDCDFKRVSGYLFAPPGESLDVLDLELDAARRAGMDVEAFDRVPWPDFNTGPCLHFPGQAQFHPLRYLRSLALAVVRNGGRIYSATHALEIQGGQPARVVTSNGKTITCKAIVVATNTPVNDRVAIHTKQAPYRTYVIAANIPTGYIPQSLYWDTLQPYHYVRVQRQTDPTGEVSELLIIGGEDHKTGQPHPLGAPFMELEKWAHKRFPQMGEVEFRWSGQIMEPVDYVAFIGRNPMDKDNVFICTGDSGQGMTHGTIASILLTDLILDRPNEWEKLYDPGRVKFRAAAEFAKENLNVARKYGEWITPGEIASLDEVQPGSGGVVRRGMKKIAVYRSENGEVYEHSASCPHLGCVVHWNNVEKTWDCPCHGSRFDKFGSVISGPAITDLKPVENETFADK